ncbi:MAG: S8 family serine peptidase [Planctomycetes bacterium]|nr:S8 family serine peptidase [Planctomycetota bacterium]
MAPVPQRRSRSRAEPARLRLATAAACAVIGVALISAALPADAGPRRLTGRGRPSKADTGTWAPWAWDGGAYGAAGPAASDWFLGFDPGATEATNGWSGWTDAPPIATPGRVLRTTVGPSPTYVHVDAPQGCVARLDTLRVTGTLPELLWIEDAEGRVWTPAAARTPKSLATEEIYVAASGGLEVVFSPTRTAVAQVDVLVSVRALDAGEVPPIAETPWAPGVMTATYDPVVSTPGGPPCGDPWGNPAAWGDPLSWAANCGFTWWTAADGVIVLGTQGGTPGREWADASAMSELMSNALPGSCGGPWFEPDALADLPETSQRNQLIVGSEFGRGYPVQPAIRSIFTPAPGRGINGAGVTIAVIDTGVDASHPAFAGRVLPGRDFVDDDDDASDERNGSDDDLDGDVDGGFGHGTVVAGIALAVAPEARILPVRVLDDEGHGTASRVAQGIRWAADHGANVINLSLGTRAWSTVLGRAVSDAVDRGVLVCVAAGNDGDRWSLDFPADVPGVAAITALGVRGRRALFGNGNRTTTIAAPGVRVIGPYPGGTFAAGTGTSFAAPLASGAAALLLQTSPGANVRDLRTKLAPRSRLDLRPLQR